MRRPVLVVLLILLALLLPSLPALPVADAATRPWAIYLNLLYGSGWLSISLMSVAMLLALRLPRLESWLGGLDLAYRAHRRLAEIGAGLGLLHYLLKLGSKEARRQGWLLKPNDFPSQALAWSEPYRDSAKSGAEWALYLVLALVAVALLRRVPYRWFAKLHRLLPAAFLVLVYHSLVFMPRAFWSSFAGSVGALLMLAGSVAALTSLFGLIGRRRQVRGEVTYLRELGLNVLELHVRLNDDWPGHESGQFALLTFDTREGAHPFTIASAWPGDGEIRFAIKALGDYTSRLPKLLSVGDAVWVEGPYGRFIFADEKTRQIWVAGGIGMTPFVARMQELAAQGGSTQPVDLFYSTRVGDDEILRRIKALADAAGVRLHALVSKRDGPLSTQRLIDAVPDWVRASVWFCGPVGFGQALRAGLTSRGLATEDFHQEAFEFR